MSENLIGKEIEAYCGKCKSDTIHLVTAVEEEKMSKLMCKTCNSYHKYRKPKGIAAATEEEITAKTEEAAKPKRRARRNKWTKILELSDSDSAIEYKMDENYEVETAILHKNFGLGVVKNIIDSRKIEVLFTDGEKVLVQNLTP